MAGSFPSSSLAEHVSAYVADRSTAEKRFRPWHVEMLLNQAADLLDRCLAERARHDALRAQWFNLQQAVLTESKNLDIERKKVEVGFYSHHKNDSEARIASLEAELALAKKAYAHAENVVVNGGGLGSNRDWESARAEEDRHAAMVERLKGEQVILAADIARESAPTGMEQVQSSLLEHNSARLLEREAAMARDRPLDFASQAKSSVSRFEADYRDAANRIVVASTGLSTIYGYPAPLKDGVGILSNGVVRRFDESVNWVREAIRWLAAFSQYDQTFLVCASLRTILGTTAWKKLLAGTDQTFHIDQSLFAAHRYVRLRGLSASTRQAASSSPFPVACVVTLPRRAAFVLEDQGNDRLSNVSQENMPPCVLGYVTDAGVANPPEIGGAISLRNASPVEDMTAPEDDRKWSIGVRAIAPDKLDRIDDFFLRLTLAGQPRM